ncbi:MAG: hypothetical protein MIO92_13530, partial [Methanosarcinaceae archaeon]|nr:hypothetical protein [Methanosarcinaceae archaeon]
PDCGSTSMDHAPISLYSKQDSHLLHVSEAPGSRAALKVRDLPLALFTRLRRAPNLRLREHLVRGLPGLAVAFAEAGHHANSVPCPAHTPSLPAGEKRQRSTSASGA